MLTDFQNYFTTEKGIKFQTNPVTNAVEKTLSDWHIITDARNVRPLQPHKNEDVDATV